MNPMAGAGGIISMGNPMVPPYGAAMQNQMTNIGMGPQVSYAYDGGTVFRIYSLNTLFVLKHAYDL